MFSCAPAPKEAKKSSQLGLSSNFLDPNGGSAGENTRLMCGKKFTPSFLVSAPSPLPFGSATTAVGPAGPAHQMSSRVGTDAA